VAQESLLKQSAGWNVALEASEEPHHLRMYAHLHTRLACFVIRMGFIPTFGTSEHFAPLFLDPDASAL
jgi:hypothetical protein